VGTEKNSGARMLSTPRRNLKVSKIFSLESVSQSHLTAPGYADGAVGLRFLTGLDLNDQPTPILKLERMNLIGDTYDSLYLFDPVRIYAHY
jgi:hypothetical protein